MLAPLPRLLCSVCLFGFTPTYKPMISQSHHHHHHHYQLTRDHYNPHSGFDAVSAPQSTAKEPDHSLYISLSSIAIARPLLDYNLHCACHPHTDSLVFRLPSLFYGGCLFGTCLFGLPRGHFVYHPCSYSNIHGRGGTGATSGDVDVPEGDDPL